MGRLLALVGGVTWLAAMAIVAVAIQRSEHPRMVPRLATLPPLIRELNSTRSSEGDPWIVTRAVSAHHVLVVEVSALQLEAARDIATGIVDKVAGRGYDEILVYVWSAKPHRRFADLRVQWTRSGGYSEMAIGN